MPVALGRGIALQLQVSVQDFDERPTRDASGLLEVVPGNRANDIRPFPQV